MGARRTQRVAAAVHEVDGALGSSTRRGRAPTRRPRGARRGARRSCSTRVPASEGPKASMTPAMIRRDSHKPQACSGGSTALICRNVAMLTSAAERERNDPRVGIDSVMRESQHEMVTFVNGNVGVSGSKCGQRRQTGFGGVRVLPGGPSGTGRAMACRSHAHPSRGFFRREDAHRATLGHWFLNVASLSRHHCPAPLCRSAGY